MSETRWHFNPDTGETGKCGANPEKGRGCPFGESRHYATEREAAMGFENENSEILLAKPMAKPTTLSERADEQNDILEKALNNREKIDGMGIHKRKVYLQEVIDRLTTAGKSTQDTYSSKTPNGQRIYELDRVMKHEEIIQEILNTTPNARKDRKAVISGGLGGAGKTTVLTGYVDMETSHYITVNADDIKEIMAEKGMIPRIKGLTAMESSPLAHEEASDVSKVLLKRLTDQGYNVVVDITIASTASAQQRVDNLKKSGYEDIQAVFVDITPETSLNRAEFRYVEGMRQFTMERKGNGGRFVPPHLIENGKTENSMFRSKNAENLVELAKNGAFTSTPLVFDNNGERPVAVPYDEFSGSYDDILLPDLD